VPALETQDNGNRVGTSYKASCAVAFDVFEAFVFPTKFSALPDMTDLTGLLSQGIVPL
jgi:hypothetical protein